MKNIEEESVMEIIFLRALAVVSGDQGHRNFRIFCITFQYSCFNFVGEEKQ
jgi:hypothetical protein